MKKAIPEIRIEGNTAYVPLTKGYEAVIDSEDVAAVAGYRWMSRECPRTVYAYRSGEMDGKRVSIMMHRVLMGEPVGLQVDHKDGDGLNNRKREDSGNLRVATRQQNQHNKRNARNNTSGFKGVTFRKDRNRWQARIYLADECKHLGYFHTPEEAASAYAKASADLHGEFGRVA